MTKSSFKMQFIKNVGTGWLAVFVTGLAAFVMLPLNLKFLGNELYGVSVLVGSTLTLFSFLKMGMQPALLRFFSRAVAEKNHEEFKSLSSVSQLLLCGLGLVGAVGFLCTFPSFISFYEIPDAVESGLLPDTAQRDLLILFLAIALDFWSNLFLIPYSAIIQASNRFDIGNLRQCIATILRIIVLFAGYSFFTPSLLILATSIFVGTFYQLISLIFLAYKIHGNMVFFHRNSLRWSLLVPLFSFSAINLVCQVFEGFFLQLPVLIIGKTLTANMVAAFFPAIQISMFSYSILMQLSAPLVPVASKDIIENNGKNLGRWAILMGEITTCVACSIIVVFALLGSDIMTAWLGESFAWTATIVTVTVIGFIFGNQTTNYRLALGGNFSLVPFALSSVAVAVVASLGTLFGTVFGGWSLLEVAVFITCVRLLRNLFYLSMAYSRQFDFRIADYSWYVHIKPLLLGFSLIGCFCLMKWLFAISWVSIPDLDISSPLTYCFFSLKSMIAIRAVYISTVLLSSLLVTCIYLFLCWKFVLQDDAKRSMQQLITNRFTKAQYNAK